MKLLNATRACSMLFSVMARTSAGTSKWEIPSLLSFMELTFEAAQRPNGIRIDRCCRRPPMWRLRFDDGHDFQGPGIDNYDFRAHQEIFIAAPSRLERDNARGKRHETQC